VVVAQDDGATDTTRVSRPTTKGSDRPRVIIRASDASHAIRLAVSGVTGPASAKTG
jgi:hypothetical protein